MLNSALLLLIRSVSIGFLCLMNPLYLLFYLALDNSIYLVQKVARGDVHYFNFLFEGWLEGFASLFLHLLVKIVTDFTGFVEARNSVYLGGAFYTFNLGLAIAVSFASVLVYFEDEDNRIASEQCRRGEEECKLVSMEFALWTLAGLSAMVVLTCSLFVKLMKPEYRSSFTDTETGAAMVTKFFVEGKDDEQKSIIFATNPCIWRGIRGEVKEWVHGNWWRWKEERPEWFSPYFQVNVPFDMLPKDDEEGRREARRASFAMAPSILGAKAPSVRFFARDPSSLMEGQRGGRGGGRGMGRSRNSLRSLGIGGLAVGRAPSVRALGGGLGGVEKKKSKVVPVME